MPRKYQKEPNLADIAGEFRYLIVWSYKIIFEIEEDRILILMIFHTSRNPEQISKP
jgi:plasmid stabilization system protein ParE